MENTQRISWSPPIFGEDEKKAAIRVVNSGWVTQGKETEQFEEELARYTHSRHAVVMNNGTSALIAALLAHGIGKGDEVIVPTFTFIATVNSVLAVGATPVLADCDPMTWNMTPQDAEKLITKNTKAIMPVDVGGMPCDIDGFTGLAKKHNLHLIEDAAEALGAEYKGNPVGSHGHCTIISFHIAKSVATIEGGAILTNDNETADKLRRIRNHGMSAPYDARKNLHYDYVDFGLNFRITDIQSAIGRVQLAKLSKIIESRNSIAQYYAKHLKDKFQLQHVPQYVTKHPYMFYGIVAPNEDIRNRLAMYLTKNNIDIRICWLPAHMQNYHSRLFHEKNYVNAQELSKKVINIPMGNDLSLDEARRVIQTITFFFDESGKVVM